MILRLISLIAVGLALSSCSDGGFRGGTRQFSGVWLYAFEESTFVEGATEIPKERPAYKETDWLEWTDWPRLKDLTEDGRENRDCRTIQPFLVKFVGYRTHHPLGGAGHLGLWRSEITIEKPISAKRIGSSFCYGG